MHQVTCGLGEDDGVGYLGDWKRWSISCRLEAQEERECSIQQTKSLHSQPATMSPTNTAVALALRPGNSRVRARSVTLSVKGSIASEVSSRSSAAFCAVEVTRAAGPDDWRSITGLGVLRAATYDEASRDEHGDRCGLSRTGCDCDGARVGG